MSETTQERVRTCSIGFGEKRYNELPYARMAARHFDCDHYEAVVAGHCADDVEALGEYYDEPFADSSALPTRRLAEMTRQHVTVALSGDGGDECFGGYDRYRAMLLAERVGQVRLLRWLAQRKAWQKLKGGEYRGALTRLKRFVGGATAPAMQRYLEWLCLFQPEVLRELCEQSALAGGADGFLANAWRENWREKPDPVAAAMRSDGVFYLPGDLNCKADRASMSVGLEVRCPFEDHKVVELAYSLPTRWRVTLGGGKRILRDACSDLLPEAIQATAQTGIRRTGGAMVPRRDAGVAGRGGAGGAGAGTWVFSAGSGGGAVAGTPGGSGGSRTPAVGTADAGTVVAAVYRSVGSQQGRAGYSDARRRKDIRRRKRSQRNKLCFERADNEDEATAFLLGQY